LPIHVYDTAVGRPVAVLLRPGKTPSGKGSGMIRGIGPVYAKKLVRAFGEAVFEGLRRRERRRRSQRSARQTADC
jgi:hypothetical protein